ncbi:lipopolysaccharide biosynthesis protein [Phocaeicola sp.]
MQTKMNFFKSIHVFFNKGNERTLSAKKNILASFLLKLINISTTLFIVPLTINYVNPTRYGIWLTLSSIITWMSYFDLGFVHGFRNKFAEAKAKENWALAQSYVSTTYGVLILIFSCVLLLALLINYFINWSNILNIDQAYNKELQLVFAILAMIFCINTVATVATTMLTADQKPALASLIQTCGQVLGLLAIFILTHTTNGSILYLAFAFSGVPCLLLIIATFFIFKQPAYHKFAPKIKNMHLGLTKDILGLGGQFFIIMLCSFCIFQFVNIILARVEGPEAVTQYNIAYKYFNVMHMVAVIILTPFWSAFTDAYAKKDFIWMQKVQRKLEFLWLLMIPLLILMLLFSPSFYKFWIGNQVDIPFSLSLCMALYVLFQTSGGLYMYLINGIGKVRLQLIVYLLFAIVAVPTMYVLCTKWGINGVLIVPCIVFFVQSIIGRIQVRKIIFNKANKIWNK